MSARRFAAAVALLLTACTRDTPRGDAAVEDAPAPPARYGLGRAAGAALVSAADVSIGPDGAGLPPGGSSAEQGAAVFARRCASCHGAAGEGVGTNPPLVGREPREGFPFGRDVKLVKTVGNYWPYATTLFDYVRRAMPLDAPGSLTGDEVYGVVAFILARNAIVGERDPIDATTLPAVRMPARERFVPDDRRGGRSFR